ncbi:MAG TPA: hypothetical protein VFM54_15015 [Micromonosporaceae bacterium]|nr:hypothetical protein [Micromonosporaceae bacterium]
MFDVLLLSLTDSSGCAATRAPVLTCRDALVRGGARPELITVGSDEEVDAVLARLDGPVRPDGLAWPDPDRKTRLVVATATDGQLRAVVRRLVRRYAPPPLRRPDDLPAQRTMPDLPPLGVLPLDTGGLPTLLGLPGTPDEVAEAVLAGRTRRLDLLRTDGGSVTLNGALLGGADADGQAVTWRGRVEVDDSVLTDGTEPVLACVVANAAGYATVDGLPLTPAADPADGVLDVAVAVPVVTRSFRRGRRVSIEVRRTRGRAVSVNPLDGELPLLEDSVFTTLSHKRFWWVESGAWEVYALPAGHGGMRR